MYLRRRLGFGDPYGSELVVNGGFSVDANWTSSTPEVYTIIGGVLVVSTPGLPHTTVNDGTVESGKTYRVYYEVSSYTSGEVKVRLGSAQTTSRNANGSYTEELTSNGTAITLVSTGVADYSIDNVSVREVL